MRRYRWARRRFDVVLRQVFDDAGKSWRSCYFRKFGQNDRKRRRGDYSFDGVLCREGRLQARCRALGLIVDESQSAAIWEQVVVSEEIRPDYR